MAGATSGPRGRKSFQPFFRVIKNTKTVRGAEQMVRDVAFRSKDLIGKEKGCFDQDRDHAEVKDFVAKIPDHLTRHKDASKAFHAVISLSREGYDRYGIRDWKPIVREVMRTYERESGRKLQWIAAQHDNPTHPHCHLIIKAVLEKENGQRNKLWLSQDDLSKFREITGRVLGYERTQERAHAREGGWPVAAQRVAWMGATFLEHLQHLMKAEKKHRRQAERDHQRWLREGDDRDR